MMSYSNLKFMYENVLRAAELRIPVDIMFSEGVVNALEAWKPVVRMESLSSAIALFNIVATTLEFSCIERTVDGLKRVPLNLFNVVVARSSYGKSDIAEQVRRILGIIENVNDEDRDYWIDEFTRAGLISSLDKATKIFVSDEADIAFVDAGLFNGIGKAASEGNCRLLVMILFDRMFSAYIRRLSKKRIVVERSKLNLLGLSTGELMGQLIVKMKNGGYWDAMIPRFIWWVLDGPPMMESLTKVVLDDSIPSIEQVSFACSLIKNCTFKYEHDALKRVVEWSNNMKDKSYKIRKDDNASSLIGKAIQQMHRFAGFLQTIEYGFKICGVYWERFGPFPLNGSVKEMFKERCEGIFMEIFNNQYNSLEENPIYFITDQVAERAIDLTSGLLQQLKILMDESTAPEHDGGLSKCMCSLSGNDKKDPEPGKKRDQTRNKLVGYVSTEKSRRIAGEILVFPSVCFTVNQLHSNTFIHNVGAIDLRAVLTHLIERELLHFIEGGVKSTRRSTDVYVKRLPTCHHDGGFDKGELKLFDSKLREYEYSTTDGEKLKVTVEKYLEKNSVVNVKAVGTAKEVLLEFFNLAEYSNIDISQLYNMKPNDDSEPTDDHVSVKDNQTSASSITISSLNERQEIFNIFESITDEIEVISTNRVNAAVSELEHEMIDYNCIDNVDIQTLAFSDANVQHVEEVASNICCNLTDSAERPISKKNQDKNKSIEKNKKKRKNVHGDNELYVKSSDWGCVFSSPPSSRLRSKAGEHRADVNDAVVNTKKNKP